MTVFRQLGDPLAGGVCLCQHHGAAYAETPPGTLPATPPILHEPFADGATIVQVPITITETCCVVVMAAIICDASYTPAEFEIERPVGTIRTQQEDSLLSNAIELMHHAAWEVLAPGTYTYHLVNRAGATRSLMGAWIKAVASDCEA